MKPRHLKADAAAETLADRSDPTVEPKVVEQLYRAEADRLEGYASRRLRDPYDARDVVHDFFATLLRVGRERFRRVDEPPAYARRAVGKLSINSNVADRARKARGTAWADMSCQESSDPHAQLEARDTLRRLEEAMAQLPERSRLIFLAIRLEGLSYAEVAQRTGLSVKRVEKVMSKAIARIDRLLDRS